MDKRQIFLSVRPTPPKNGKMFYVFITVADLTGRKLKWRQNGICMTRQVACGGVKVI